MERHLYINGIKVIKYSPSHEENLENMKVAKRIRKKLEKELVKPVEKEVLQKQANDLLSQLERDFAL